MQALYNRNTIDVMGDDTITIKDHIEPGIYKVRLRPMQSPVLEKQAPFPALPDKRYGKNDARAAYIVTQFATTQDKNLGCLFVGAKGTGKSMLAKSIAHAGQHFGWPVIFIDDGYPRSILAHFLSKITQKCIVIFDEFEKNYTNDYDEDENRPNQQSLLSLMDGDVVQNKLFVFTANRERLITDYMLNRPGRIRYLIRFEGLDEDEIKEYCNENLNDKDLIPKVVQVARTIQDFSYDQLVSLVEEINNHPDYRLADIMELFNLKPDRFGRGQENLELISFKFDKDILLPNISTQHFHAFMDSSTGVRFSSRGRDVLTEKHPDFDGNPDKDVNWIFGNEDIIDRTPDGTIVFHTDAYSGLTITVRPRALVYDGAIDFIGI